MKAATSLEGKNWEGKAVKGLEQRSEGIADLEVWGEKNSRLGGREGVWAGGAQKDPEEKKNALKESRNLLQKAVTPWARRTFSEDTAGEDVFSCQR